MKDLARSLVERMPELTVARSAEDAMANARANNAAATSGSSITDLSPSPGPGFVVSAGPSLHRRDPARLLQAHQVTSELLVAVDAALGYCLRAGVVPAYVVCLDPHPTRIIRWFGDPLLTSREDDGYFRQQELDPHLRHHEIERNCQLVDLVNQHGSSVKAVLATSVHPTVAERCRDAGMTIYWWNPMLDDPADVDGLTRQLHRLNGLPAMMTGGNVGTASWVLSHQVLRRDPVVLLGMDFGYAPGTPLENTQYYSDLRQVFGDRAAEAYVEIPNPHTDEVWFADPTYYWYGQSFLQLAVAAACTTINCTEGGTVFGEGVQVMPLEAQLAAMARDNGAGT